MSYQKSKRTHVTLPSVEGVNILRDPPRSVTTRRITKVGQDDTLLNLQDGSGDRVAEAIKVYARGQNPMVEVAYSNNTNVSGQGSIAGATRRAQASLPYKVMDGGAFRAPIVAPTSLLPLSRLPRTHTYAASNPQFVDFTKRLTCGTNAKNTRDVTPGCVNPTYFQRKDTIQELRNAPVRDRLSVDVQTNIRGRTKVDFATTDVALRETRTAARGYTNLSGYTTGSQHNPETTIIKRQLKFGDYDERPSMPFSDYGDMDVKSGGVGSARLGQRQTRVQ